jgi:hypothetical protein
MSPRDLLDDDGENRALRAFLLYYQNGGDKSVGAMRAYMQLSGWHGCWPDWVARDPDSAHLTKAGAQQWIRHLIDIESQPRSAEPTP